ncbi:hypothetical protein [Sharpea azabuensis]|uniref:hypothetical protein n=1 Tax=Sharpea azabuensis TaxID=322505 RepID=UPI00156ABB83|nr:hypothetical protein [Sharpea azabuensis]
MEDFIGYILGRIFIFCMKWVLPAELILFPVIAIATGDKEIAKIAIDFYIYMGVCFAILALALYAQYKLTPSPEETERKKKEREEELKETYDKVINCKYPYNKYK